MHTSHSKLLCSKPSNISPLPKIFHHLHVFFSAHKFSWHKLLGHVTALTSHPKFRERLSPSLDHFTAVSLSLTQTKLPLNPSLLVHFYGLHTTDSISGENVLNMETKPSNGHIRSYGHNNKRNNDCTKNASARTVQR